MTPVLRAYHPSDRAACLAVFDANMPASFLPHERPDFEVWLDQEVAQGEYFVVLHGSQVIGCGGLWVGEDVARPAGFAWGMVHPDWQGRGVGARLAQARLNRLRELGVKRAVLDTSQVTAPFYARFGFQEIQRVPDGYGPGLDRVDMQIDL